MRRSIAILILALLSVVSAVSAQTRDCGDLTGRIDTLTAQVEILTEMLNVKELGQVKEKPDEAVMKFGSFEQVQIGDFAIDFYSQQQYTTPKGDDILLLKLFFQNKSEETVSFASRIRVKAFQHGVGLQKFKADDNYLKEIGPGMSVVVAQVYQFYNYDEPVEIVFTPRLSPDSEPVTRMLPVKK